MSAPYSHVVPGSWSGHLVSARRRRRSISTLFGICALNGLIAAGFAASAWPWLGPAVTKTSNAAAKAATVHRFSVMGSLLIMSTLLHIIPGAVILRMITE